jgi:hypothetical protein
MEWNWSEEFKAGNVRSLEKFPIALSEINLRKVEIYMYNFFPLHMIGIRDLFFLIPEN